MGKNPNFLLKETFGFLINELVINQFTNELFYRIEIEEDALRRAHWLHWTSTLDNQLTNIFEALTYKIKQF